MLNQINLPRKVRRRDTLTAIFAVGGVLALFSIVAPLFIEEASFEVGGRSFYPFYDINSSSDYQITVKDLETEKRLTITFIKWKPAKLADRQKTLSEIENVLARALLETSDQPAETPQNLSKTLPALAPIFAPAEVPEYRLNFLAP